MSRIYADCQQKLFSSQRDPGRRILQVTFLAEQKRGYDAQRKSSLTQSLYFFVNVHFTSLLKCTRNCIQYVNSKINLLLYQFMALL